MDQEKNRKKAKIAIYQITEKDEDCLCFMNYQYTSERTGIPFIDKDRYQKVYEYNSDIHSLEEVYEMFNLNIPNDYKGRSLSVSDVVVVETDDPIAGTYFCDSIGFKKVDFVSSDELNWKYEIGLETSNAMDSGSSYINVVYAETEEDAKKALVGRNDMRRYSKCGKYKQYYDFVLKKWRWS